MNLELRAEIREDWRRALKDGSIFTGKEDKLCPWVSSQKKAVWDRPPTKKTVTMYQVLEAVCNVMEVSHESIRGVRRNAAITAPRQMAYALMAELCPHQTIPAIGDFMNKDHTTILHGVSVHKKKMAKNPRLVVADQEVRKLLFP